MQHDLVRRGWVLYAVLQKLKFTTRYLHTGWCKKKRPELCVTTTARILYGDKFPFVLLYSYSLVNFKDLT